MIQGSSSINERSCPRTPARNQLSTAQIQIPAAENQQQKTRRTQPSANTEMPTKQNAQRAQQRADPDQRATELRPNSLANQATANLRAVSPTDGNPRACS